MSANTIDHQILETLHFEEVHKFFPSMLVGHSKVTHEEYLHAVRKIAVARLNDETAKRHLLNAKLAYGSARGVRGICYFQAWEDGKKHEFIEVSASGEESDVQLAGTTIHELAHCLAGRKAGHGSTWKHAAKLLGLIRAQAAGQGYVMADFDPNLWAQIQILPLPTDGRPAFIQRVTVPSTKNVSRVKSCPLGIATRGGKTRGQGSGSRLRLFICDCKIPVKVRVARDIFNARCLICESDFRRAV